MEAMRWSLQRDNLFMGAKHAAIAADAAEKIGEESEDRDDAAATAAEMKSLARDMNEAAKQGKCKR